MLSGPVGQISRAGTALVDTITLRAPDLSCDQGLGSFLHVDAELVSRYRADYRITVTTPRGRVLACEGRESMAELPDGTVTFLLTDVEGSTALWEEASEPMRAALARHDALFEAVVATHSGVHIRPRG